jgi:micrococcal nuclease|tara:strand:+ start:774 stop:1253 length:480 start_codon:yes stop_codon:yes gene_type:complete
MYEYRVKILKVVDGDTVDVDIDLGFGVTLTDERVRIMGIDTPESRTRDKVEKVFGKAAKKALQDMLGKTSILKTQINRDGEDMKGKFGRILGDFIVDRNGQSISVVKALVEDGHAVDYYGGSKEDIQKAHMVNRKKLIDEGVVEMSYEKAGLTDTGLVV